MNYQRLYNLLIEDARLNPKDEKYKENHHIIPECSGGSNSKDNIIALTARQHFLAHWLLYKIYRTSKLANAWHNMCRIGKGQEERRVNSKFFAYARKAHSENLSREMQGKGNRFYGKKHSEETKAKISKANTGRIVAPKDALRFIEMSKKKKTAEHRSKIGRKDLIMIQNIHTLEIKRVEKSSINIEYDVNIWVNPRKLKPEQKFKCQHCEIVTNASNLKRWHNDNCKRKRIEN